MLIGEETQALGPNAQFDSIRGGKLSLDQWIGQPLLVVNTASKCGFTDQYKSLQTLYDSYRDRGLVVLAVPSNDFKQELSSDDEVKEFCEIHYGTDMPMTTITHVKGADAHPFYKVLKRDENYVPKWNFSKVLIGPNGGIVGTYSSDISPTSSQILNDIEALLNWLIRAEIRRQR